MNFTDLDTLLIYIGIFFAGACIIGYPLGFRHGVRDLADRLSDKREAEERELADVLNAEVIN